MSIKASNVTLNVKDLDNSIQFYQSIGLTLKHRWGQYYAQMEAPGLVIGLHPTSGMPNAQNSGNASIGFTADDFDATKVLLQALNIDISLRIEDGGNFIHFSDPDGTFLYFIEPKW